MSRDELDRLMREQGIAPQGETLRPAPKTKAAPRQKPASSGLVQRLAQHYGATQQPRRPTHAPKSLPAQKREQEQLETLLAEVDGMAERMLRAETEAKAGRARVKAAVAKEAAALERSRAAAGEAKGLRTQVETLRAQLAQAQAGLTGGKGAQAALAHQVADLQARIVPTRSLHDTLVARGVRPDQVQGVLADLALEHPTVLAGAQLTEPQAQALSQRVVLAGPDAELPEDAVVVAVPADRCELSAGPVAARWDDLVAACELAGVGVLCVVGGSTAYRKRLKQLSKGAGLTLRLVPGDSRRPKHQADADVRIADRVVIWGGTELDHAVSGQYQGPTVWTVSHRGLSGFLSLLAARMLAGV
jgi:hypothetical protein